MTVTKKPKKTAKPKDAKPAFDPAADCCNRNSPGENHAEGCANCVAPEPPPAEACDCELIGAPERPVGATCTICDGIIPAPAAELPPAVPPASPDALLEKDGQSGADAKPALHGAALTVAESRKSLTQPPPAGMKFFESPEGYIEIGDANKSRVFCRHTNDGKGGWINSKR